MVVVVYRICDFGCYYCIMGSLWCESITILYNS